LNVVLAQLSLHIKYRLVLTIYWHVTVHHVWHHCRHLYERPFQQRLLLSNALTDNSSQTCSGSSFHMSGVACRRLRVLRMSCVSAEVSPSVDDRASCRRLDVSRWMRRSTAAAASPLHVPPTTDSTQLWTCKQATTEDQCKKALSKPTV